MGAILRFSGQPPGEMATLLPVERSIISPWPAESSGRRDDLVLEHLPLVKSVAARCRVKLPVHLEFNDLVQAGILGLMDAVCKYDPETEAAFSTYATHRIKGAILDSLRGQDPAPRTLRRQHRELERVRSQLTQELQRCPTEWEVSERSGVDLESLRATLLDIHHLDQMSGPVFAPSSKNHVRSMAFIDQPEFVWEAKERASLVQELIGRLPESYREVVTLYYTTGLSLKEIGGSFGVSEGQVSRIHKRALQQIHEMLTAKGITSRGEL
jgi:RNA polymerase sigma factor for flagellar operon FliA